MARPLKTEKVTYHATCPTCKEEFSRIVYGDAFPMYCSKKCAAIGRNAKMKTQGVGPFKPRSRPPGPWESMRQQGSATAPVPASEHARND